MENILLNKIKFNNCLYIIKKKNNMVIIEILLKKSDTGKKIFIYLLRVTYTITDCILT